MIFVPVGDQRTASREEKDVLYRQMVYKDKRKKKPCVRMGHKFSLGMLSR